MEAFRQLRKFGAIISSAVITTALVSCTTTVGDGVFAPTGTPKGQESVDAMLVGHRLMASSEYELARKAYLRAASREGLTAEVLTSLGSADLGLGRIGQAESNLRSAIEIDDEFVPAWNNLGVVLMEQGKYAEARRVFEVAFSLDSGKTESIAQNLKLALAKSENQSYGDPNNNSNFSLIRQGTGEYLLLGEP